MTLSVRDDDFSFPACVLGIPGHCSLAGLWSRNSFRIFSINCVSFFFSLTPPRDEILFLAFCSEAFLDWLCQSGFRRVSVLKVLAGVPCGQSKVPHGAQARGPHRVGCPCPAACQAPGDLRSYPSAFQPHAVCLHTFSSPT